MEASQGRQPTAGTEEVQTEREEEQQGQEDEEAAAALQSFGEGGAGRIVGGKVTRGPVCALCAKNNVMCVKSAHDKCLLCQNKRRPCSSESYMFRSCFEADSRF